MYSLQRKFLTHQSDKCTVFLFELLFVISYLNCTLWFEGFCSFVYYMSIIAQFVIGHWEVGSARNQTRQEIYV